MTLLTDICEPAWAEAAARRYGRSVHHMQDIGQIAAMKYLVQQRRGTIRHPSAYLGQVIRRTLIDEARAAVREPKPMSRDIVDCDRVLMRATRRDLADSCEVVAERLDLVAVIERLPPKERDVVRRSLAGESIRDIAERDGVPEDTIRHRRNRAVDALRQELSDEDVRSGRQST